jgi:hypothetical protein
MKGRGDLRNTPSNRGGRGYGGTREIVGKPTRTGTIAAIGAYLDFLPGRDINQSIVTTWMTKAGEYIAVNNNSKINQIFGTDGTIGAYPTIIEPTAHQKMRHA